MSTKGKSIYLHYLFLLFFLFLLFPGWFFQMPQAGQDSSRDIAIHLARKYHLIFGKDIRLPYGPLGILNSRLPIAVNVLTYLFFDIYFLVTLFFILRKILAEHFHYAVVGFLVLAIGLTMRQSLDDWFFFFLLFYLFAFLREPSKRVYLLLAAFPAAAGVFLRVDIGLFGAAVFLVTLGYAGLRKKLTLRAWGLGSLLFLLMTLVAGWILHVEWGSYLLTQLHSSRDIVDARYEPSTVMDGLLTHLAAEISLCMVYWTACLTLVAGVRKDWRKRADEMFVCVIATLSVFFYFKTGFLRMDDALWRSFGVSTLLAAFLYLFGPTDGWRKVPVLCCWIILALCGLAVLMGKRPDPPFAGIANGSFFKTRAREIGRYWSGLANYRKTLADLEHRTAEPGELKALTGSQPADILPWEVSTLYFNGLSYSPRPAVQSFYTTNAWMDSLNYLHYLSPEAPAYVLLSFDAIHSHFAFFDEPRAKLALLDDYDPLTETGDMLVLKNGHRRRLQFAGESAANVRLDEDIDIASNDALQYSRFYIRYDSRGRRDRFFDQPPGLRIMLTLNDGSVRTGRITRPMLEDGIIVNRFVDDKEEFQLLVQGQGRLTPQIRKIRIQSDSVGIGFVPEVRMVNSYYRFRERTAGERTADSIGLIALRERHRPQLADPRYYRPDGLRAWFEQLDTTSQLVKLKGWAFNENSNDTGLLLNPVLRSRDHFFVMAARAEQRPDLTARFGRDDIVNAGFSSVIAKSLLPPGDYELGVAAGREGDSLRSVTFTDRELLIRSKYSVRVSGPILPVADGNAGLKLNLDRAVTWKGQVYFDGWAYLESADTGRRTTTIVLSGKQRTYRIGTDALRRMDVAASLKNPAAMYAGFTTSIPEDTLEKGEYWVGVEQTCCQGSYRSVLFGPRIKIGANDVILPVPAPPLPPIQDFLSGVDHYDDQNEFFTISGWAIRDMKEVASSQIDLVFYKDNATYVARTDRNDRKDLTEHYHNGLNLDNSGFTAKISKETLAPGRYQLGIWVHSKENRGSVRLLDLFTFKP